MKFYVNTLTILSESPNTSFTRHLVKMDSTLRDINEHEGCVVESLPCLSQQFLSKVQRNESIISSFDNRGETGLVKRTVNPS